MQPNTLAPTTSIIMTAMQSGMSYIDAISEFVDNSFGPAAGNSDEIIIVDAGDGTLFWDRGNGVDDINKLFRLGDGSSRASKDDIGRFGVGSKFGALTFGTKVSVFTVHNGKYHHFEVDWKQVMESGQWPKAYNNFALQIIPTHIKNMIGGGGTIVLIKHLHDPKHIIQTKTYVTRLGLRFMPSLEKGKSIKVYRAASVKKALAGEYTAEISIADQFATHLNKKLANIGTARLVVGDKSATAKFAEIPDGDKTLSGIHITFGGRVIDSVDRIDGASLPSKFFARIDLGAEYKSALNYNKTVLMSGKDELIDALLVAAKDLLDKLSADDAQRGIEKLAAAINNTFDQSFGALLRAAKLGGYQKSQVGDEVEVKKISEVNDPSQPNSSTKPNPNSELAQDNAEEGTTHDLRGSFAFELEAGYYGKEALAASCDLVDGKRINCRVKLNKDVPVVEEALRGNPGNKPAVTLICVSALAHHILYDDAWIRRLLADGADAIIEAPLELRGIYLQDAIMKKVIAPTKRDAEEQLQAAE